MKPRIKYDQSINLCFMGKSRLNPNYFAYFAHYDDAVRFAYLSRVNARNYIASGWDKLYETAH